MKQINSFNFQSSHLCLQDANQFLLYKPHQSMIKFKGVKINNNFGFWLINLKFISTVLPDQNRIFKLQKCTN